MEFLNCPCSGRSLARLVQPAVMAVLAQEDSYGYAILRRLRAMAMFKRQAPDPTGVYRLLRAMEEDGLLQADWDTPARGLARRRYHLKPQGRRCLKRWVRTLQAYQAEIGDVLAIVAAAAKDETHRSRARPADRKRA